MIQTSLADASYNIVPINIIVQLNLFHREAYFSFTKF